MARIAHLILTHKSPNQVIRLINALAHPLHDVYVHVDKKIAIEPFRQQRGSANTYFINKRHRVDWGAFNTVEAMLSAMSEILDRGQYDFINLLSGADYPLVTPEVVNGFLNHHPQKSFMEFHKEGSPWWETARSRTEKIHLANYRFKGRYVLQQLINLFPFKRKPPQGIELVGKSQWFTMATTHVAYILHYVAKNPEIARFFKHAWGPDEFFFPTILYNSPYRDEIVNDNLRYIDWSERMASPRVLTIDDFPKLTSSEKFYARKFDVDVDPSVLDMLDTDRLTVS